MLNEDILLQDIKNAECTATEAFEKLFKKYPRYEFCMSVTSEEYRQLGGKIDTKYTVDISCHLKKD